MDFYKDKIIFTGGSGRFGNIFKKKYNLKNIIYPSKKQLNIENYISIKNFLKKNKPKIIIHAAALSRPMYIHDQNPRLSIKTNIIGTSNLVMAAILFKIKLIYLSTNYVYPLNKKSNKETDPVLPINNYATSKMGGECAVQMHKNSLILRICMTEKPFVHKQAYSNFLTSFLYHDEVADIIPKIINSEGILNIGGKPKSLYKFAKLSNSKVKKVTLKKNNKNYYFKNYTLDISRLKQILKTI